MKCDLSDDGMTQRGSGGHWKGTVEETGSLRIDSSSMECRWASCGGVWKRPAWFRVVASRCCARCGIGISTGDLSGDGVAVFASPLLACAVPRLSSL
eukprot:13418375-Alexandrium_andersonii.AAC.1